MSHIQKRMIREAEKLYKNIYPCSGKPRLEDCFTKMDSNYIFWFNTSDHSTHIVTSEAVAA